MTARILVVEDEADVRDLMLMLLKREGYEVLGVESAEAGEKTLRSGGFQLLVLDWMLPGRSGVEFCRGMKAQGWNLPVLMVTARADSQDIVQGLEVGADDYVTKPFEIPIFLARVRALLRRGSGPVKAAQESKLLRVRDITLNRERYSVMRGHEELHLTPYEFRLLATLMENQGRVMTRERLMDQVQGSDVSVVDRTIDTHVFGLRKKLGDSGEIIETIRGVGYRIESSDG